MPIFFKKKWWSGTDRDTDPGHELDLDWAPPEFSPGWTVQYNTPKKTEKGYAKHVGKIRFVLRDEAKSMDFYRVIRLKNDTPEVTFAGFVLKRIEAD